MDTLSFIEAGGGAMVSIVIVSIIIWSLMVERAWYYWRVYPNLIHRKDGWQIEAHDDPWLDRRIRDSLISQNQQALHRFLPMVSSLIKVCPLLGLLGTVIGMIEVFEVIDALGHSDPRAMAYGISQATTSTLAGMVIALSSLILNSLLERRANSLSEGFRNEVSEL